MLRPSFLAVTRHRKRASLIPAQIWGAPEQIDNYNLFFNSGIQVSDDLEVYAFGNYGSRETIGGFYYRNPNSRGGVYTNGSTRAVVDTNIRNRATGVTSNCPALTSPGSGGNGAPLIKPKSQQMHWP